MYESGDMGKDVDVIDKINEENKQREIEAEQTRLNTIHQMELNRQVKPEIRDKIKELSEGLGLNALREDIDATKNNIQYLAGEMAKLVNAVNNINTTLSNPTQLQNNSSNGQDNKLAILGQLIDSPIGKALADRFLSPPIQQNSILSPEYVNERLTKSATATFDLGEALMSKLTSKVMGKALTNTLSDIIDNDDPV